MTVASCIAKCVYSVTHGTMNVPASLQGGGSGFASFTADNTNPVAGQVVTFTNTSTDAVSYSWDFGDGTVPSTATSPTHYFTGPGPYTVTLTATNAGGQTSTATSTITLATTGVFTLSRMPYQNGTAITDPSNASWTKYNSSATGTAGTAPDGTNTAVSLNEGAANAVHQAERVFSTTSGDILTSTFYAKYVDRQYLLVNYWIGGVYSAVTFDLTNGTVVASQKSSGTVGFSYSITSIGGGWYRISTTRLITGATTYLAICTASSTSIDGDGYPAAYTGTNKSVLLWGFATDTQGDAYSTTTHYLGAEQIPAPTTTIAAPVRLSGYRLLNSCLFDGDVDDANYASFGFESFTGNDPVLTIPVGAKLDATIDSPGTHGRTRLQNWIATWDKSSGYALPQQVGAWFYFDKYPTSHCMLVGQQDSIGAKNGISMTSDGKLYWNENAVTITNIRATAVPLNTWVWIGLGVSASGSTLKKMYKEESGAVEYLTGGATSSYSTFSNNFFVGVFNGAFNIDHQIRIAGATRHSLLSINDAGYPNEVIPPQLRPYVYAVDPVSGNDANNGITGAWQTVTKLNEMIGVDRCIISDYDDSDYGLGATVTIDTSAQPFDVGTTGIVALKNHLQIKAKPGNTWIDIKAYADIASGSWSATGGHANTYQVACTFADTRLFCKTDAELYKKVADLTALDLEADKAFCWVANVLYLKSTTNPASNGKSYLYTRFRTGPSTIGEPAVGLCGDMWLVKDIRCWYTAYDNNGSYCIGDVGGVAGGPSPGSGKVYHFDVRYTDKHSICFTQNTTGKTIIVENGVTEQGLAQPLTTYMDVGTGNTAIWRNITCSKDWLRENMPAGDKGGGVFYSHGGGVNRFDLIWIDSCNFGIGDVGIEAPANLFKITDSTVGRVACQCVLLIDNSTISLLGEGYSQGITNNLTITDSTIRDSSGTGLLYGLVTANIIAMTGNTYYATAGQQIVKNFNGTNNYTFAQWQALGFDAGSTRIDP